VTTTPRPRAVAAGDVQVTLGQAEWWRTRDGSYHLVKDLTPDHRANIANWLLDRAPMLNFQIVQQRMFWPPSSSHYTHDGFDPEWWTFPTAEEIRDAARRSQDAFLDHVKASPLYRAMIDGVQ